MTIKVYASIMPGEPDNVYSDDDITIEKWLLAQTPDYKRGPLQPISCSINGVIIKPLEWPFVVIYDSDNVEFRVVPRGGVLGDVLSFVFPFFAGSLALAGAAIDLFTPSIPGQQGQGEQGRRANPADAKANTARLGEGIPELLGLYIRYPDYLNAPRRYYQDTRTQVLRLMLSVGVGRYEINPSTIRIGETAIGDISGAAYEIFEPGASVAGNPAHENWYNAPEVSGTSSGPGLRLKGITFDERTYSGSGASTSTDILSAIVVKSRWAVGISGSVNIEQAVNVTGNVITGAFQHLVVGQTVNVESTLAVNGTYVIASLNVAKTEIELETGGGVPITPTVGAGFMTIDKAGTLYVLSEIISTTAIRLERVLTGGATDPDWANTLPQLASASVDIAWTASELASDIVGPFVACPTDETTQNIEIDVFASQGFGTIDGDAVNTRSRTVTIRWREVGTVTWNEQDEVVSGATRDQLGWTFSVSLPSAIQPEIEVVRSGAESTALEALDRLELTALRSKLPTVTSYEGVTTIAVTITGADDIGGRSNNQINLEATRKLEPVAGGVETATRSISRAAAYVAKSLGYGVDQLDVVEFERLDALWISRGDTFDYVFSSGTAKDAIDTILMAGYAEMTLNNGVITPVRDEPRTQYEQGYSPENMTEPLQRTFKGQQPDEPDGVEVEYTRAGTWTTETVNAFLPGDQGVKVDKIKLEGVTDETKAWRIGMRRRRAQRYRRWSYSFTTELDALNSNYLSYVPLLDDVPRYGKVAILQSISADRITVSEPLVYEAGVNYVVAYRDEAGDTVGPFPAAQGSNDREVLVSIPLPYPLVNPSDREPTHVYFGPVDRWNFPALITEISPRNQLEVAVTAINYDDRVYLSDDESL
jgi:hypothetical protein